MIISKNIAFVELKPQYQCNHNCNYCLWQSRKSWRPMSHQEIKDNLRYLDEVAQPELLVLSGGEPLLHHSFSYLLLNISELNDLKHFHLHTNATLVDSSNKKLLATPKIEKSATVGIPSHIAAVYDKICGKSGHFDRARRGVDVLQQAGYELRASVVLCKENIDDMVATALFLLREGFRLVEFRIPIVGPEVVADKLLLPISTIGLRLQELLDYFKGDPRIRLNGSSAFCFGTRYIEKGLGNYQFIDVRNQLSKSADGSLQITAICEDIYHNYLKSSLCEDCIFDISCRGYSKKETALGYARYQPYLLDEFGFS